MASKGFKVLKPTVRFEIACPIGSRKMPSFECLECRPSANSNFGLKIQKKIPGAKIFAKSLRNLLPKWVTKNDPGLISSVYLQYQTTPKGIQKADPKWSHIFYQFSIFRWKKCEKKIVIKNWISGELAFQAPKRRILRDPNWTGNFQTDSEFQNLEADLSSFCVSQNGLLFWAWVQLPPQSQTQSNQTNQQSISNQLPTQKR